MAWKNPWYDPLLPHHAPEGFHNPEPDPRRPGDFRRWRRERKAAGLPRPPAEGYAGFCRRWWQAADLSGSGDAVWWLGHASLLLRLQQRYVLIDPVLSARASPLPFAGPARKTPPPLVVDDLPGLDWLLISHNHYDHLDRRTVRQLLRRFPDVEVVVPLGLKRWFSRLGARRVVELDWWQSHARDGWVVHAVPARHWSMRTPFDRNRSLWCGFVLQAPGLRFWFSGDSGASDRLLAIPQRLGPFNLLALPTGAWQPEWFMQGQHMNPAQAVALWRACGMPLTLPIHWGVFELADESLDAAPAALAAAVAAWPDARDTFLPWKIGERRDR
ncbi:MBL fold metallo-hydrolase [Pantoea sp. 1.19]|uniref:MBL fold metallo-hydrolase n=1 Tax=Pantoea sp. 1.19 TaxID=1925589 RepID=UPI0009489B53|nr:MBL fold metallo-hydrolase [Pantoea sp. 1.19]